MMSLDGRRFAIAPTMDAADTLQKGFLEQWLAHYRGRTFVVPNSRGALT
jgi:hypothetical protein